MKARQRSLSGFLLGIVLIPVLAGLVGCFEILPVPLGDPEKSRVDSGLSGLWLGEEGVWALEPYDKRTWLVSVYSISDDDCEAVEDPEEADPGETVEPGPEAGAGDDVIEAPGDEDGVETPSDEETFAAPLDEEVIEVVLEDDYATPFEALRARGTDCLSGELDMVVKAWLTKIGKGEFLTWEIKGIFDEDTGFAPQEWIAFRMIREGEDTLRLKLIDAEFEGFDAQKVRAKLDRLKTAGTGDKRALDSARRSVERVIRRNLDNDDLYFEGDFAVLLRIQPQDYDIFVGDIVPGLE